MRLNNQKFEDRPESKNQQNYKDIALKTNVLWQEHHNTICYVCKLYEYQRSAGSGRKTFLAFMEKIGKIGTCMFIIKGSF